MYCSPGNCERPRRPARPQPPALPARLHPPERSGPEHGEALGGPLQQQPSHHRRQDAAQFLPDAVHALPHPAESQDQLLAGVAGRVREDAQDDRSLPQDLLAELHQDERPSGDGQRAPDVSGAPLPADRSLQPESPHLDEYRGSVSDAGTSRRVREVYSREVPGNHARAQR